MRTSWFKQVAASLVVATGLLLPFTAAAEGTQAAASARDDHDWATPGSLCPKQLQRRSPDQVLEAHLAALRSGNAALIACDFAKDAVVLLPGTLAVGVEQIQATFAGLLRSAGALNSLVVTSTTTRDGVILLTYKIDSEHILVAEGADTFIIEKGRILAQTIFLGGVSLR